MDTRTSTTQLTLNFLNFLFILIIISTHFLKQFSAFLKKRQGRAVAQTGSCCGPPQAGSSAFLCSPWPMAEGRERGRASNIE